MHKYLLDFLKALEERIPPPHNCHHAITYSQYGSADSGWKDMLALQVNVSGKFNCFFLSEKDMKNEPNDLVETIASILGTPASDAQLGIGFGQYVKA